MPCCATSALFCCYSFNLRFVWTQAEGAAADLSDPLAELHMEDYDTDEEGDEMKTETASRLFGSGNPGVCCL